MRIIFALATALAFLTFSVHGVAAQPAGTALESELETLLGWVIGEFDNRQQVERGENSLLESAADPAKAPDLLYPLFARVEAPALGVGMWCICNGRSVAHRARCSGSVSGPSKSTRSAMRC